MRVCVVVCTRARQLCQEQPHIERQATAVRRHVLMSSLARRSQASLADITLPDVITQGSNDDKQWEDEDPLFFGGAIEAGDNPLDVNYDMDVEQMRSEMVEEPEVRRDSDGSALKVPSARPSGLDEAMEPSQFDMPDIDFEPEPAAARESEAHALSLGGDSAGPTPMRTSEDGLEFDTPKIEVKKAKKGKAKIKKDKETNLDTETYKKWISDPESVKDILREPRPLPRNREEVCVCVCVCVCVQVCTCRCVLVDVCACVCIGCLCIREHLHTRSPTHKHTGQASTLPESRSAGQASGDAPEGAFAGMLQLSGLFCHANRSLLPCK